MIAVDVDHPHIAHLLSSAGLDLTGQADPVGVQRHFLMNRDKVACHQSLFSDPSSIARDEFQNLRRPGTQVEVQITFFLWFHSIRNRQVPEASPSAMQGVNSTDAARSWFCRKTAKRERGGVQGRRPAAGKR